MLYAEGHEPLHKVTIIPRGRALGVTMFLPERDKYSQSKMEIEAMLASLFGGRVAEELIFGAGEGHDRRLRRHPPRDRPRAPHGHRVRLQRQARAAALRENEEEVFLGHSVTQRKNVSDATAKVIDEEIRRIVEEGERDGARDPDRASRRAARAGARACSNTRRCRPTRSAASSAARRSSATPAARPRTRRAAATGPALARCRLPAATSRPAASSPSRSPADDTGGDPPATEAPHSLRGFVALLGAGPVRRVASACGTAPLALY